MSDRSTSGTPSRSPFEILGLVPDQIGIVVADLEGALRDFGPLGPFSVYRYAPSTIPRLVLGGEPAAAGMILAINESVPMIELIEPEDDRSFYAPWLKTHGPGVHHLGFLVDDIHVSMERMEAAGYPTLYFGTGYGLDGDGGFAYHDTTRATGCLLESIEIPKQRRPPLRRTSAPAG